MNDETGYYVDVNKLDELYIITTSCLLEYLVWSCALRTQHIQKQNDR